MDTLGACHDVLRGVVALYGASREHFWAMDWLMISDILPAWQKQRDNSRVLKGNWAEHVPVPAVHLAQ